MLWLSLAPWAPSDGAMTVKHVPSLKIYQPELRAGCLFQLSDGKLLLVTVDIPLPLQAQESRVAEVYVAGVQRLSLRLESRCEFDRVQRLSSFDGDKPITLAERVLSRRWATG